MKAVNLLFLTRPHESQSISRLLEVLSGRSDRKCISPHEAATLWSLTDRIAGCLKENPDTDADDWVPVLDGFYFSYAIEHIGKEFDLLKASSDGRCILNIELKSDQVEEERIRKQLLQNRYYLAHIAHTIYSFTYVMETDCLYKLNDKGVLNRCRIEELVFILRQEALAHFLPEGIENCFRTAEYLISPISNPEKFLQGMYFLTNQQFDFRRKILGFLKEHPASEEENAIIAVAGIAGTGKTLLLLDLAKELSEKRRVLFVHSGKLRRGHIEIDKRLKRVDIISGERVLSDANFTEYACMMIDEADHLDAKVLERVFQSAASACLPVIVSYDPHYLLTGAEEVEKIRSDVPETTALIEKYCTLNLAFTGHIRINSPIYSFLRNLLYLKEKPAGMDYSCIDVLYANDREEQSLLEAYYQRHRYVLVGSSGGSGGEDDMIAREYDNVMMVLDGSFYYDETGHLRTRSNEREAMRLLYDGLSRTRERICLITAGNQELFDRILAIRLNR